MTREELCLVCGVDNINLEEYLVRNKETENLTWTDISDLINDYFGFSRSRHYYSRNYSYMINEPISVDDKILELQKEYSN